MSDRVLYPLPSNSGERRRPAVGLNPKSATKAARSQFAFHLTERFDPCGRPRCQCSDDSLRAHALLSLLTPEEQAAAYERFGIKNGHAAPSRDEAILILGMSDPQIIAAIDCLRQKLAEPMPSSPEPCWSKDEDDVLA